jgi:mono/diheme cytochrome c family protein
MKHVVRIGLALFISAVVVLPTFAQEGDAGEGLAVAQDTCAGCHAIRKGQQSANANAPAFEEIAGVPGMTAIALQASLQTSHRSMPNLILSTEDRRNVAAYILSLKPR